MAKALTKMQLGHLDAALKKSINKKVADARLNFPEYFIPLPTAAEKLVLIFAGKADLRPQKEITQYTDFHAAYVTQQEKEREKVNKVLESFRVSAQMQANEIYEKAVFLGAEEAFALLKDFQVS